MLWTYSKKQLHQVYAQVEDVVLDLDASLSLVILFLDVLEVDPFRQMCLFIFR